MWWSGYFRQNCLVFLPCGGCLSVGTPPSQTFLWTSSEFSLPKRLPGTQPEIVHAHQQLHRVFPYVQAHTLWHLWCNQSNEPWPRRGSHTTRVDHQSIPAKGRKAAQHSTGNGRYSQTGEPWGMEVQGVGLSMSKIKGIRTRSRADWRLSGAQ